MGGHLTILLANLSKLGLKPKEISHIKIATGKLHID